MRLFAHLLTAAGMAALLLLASCSSGGSTFRLEGRFNNMNQAEFYIFDTQRGVKDTITVQRGRFAYERTIEDTTTLLVMFPNYSTLPIIAHAGGNVKMQGDASHLRQTKVTGTDDNDELTAFRLKAAQLTPPEAKEAARAFIEQHPASCVSLYLLQNYFVQTVTPDYGEASRLAALMAQATPTKMQVVLLNKQLAELSRGLAGNRLPGFCVLDAKGHVRTNKDLQKKVNVVCLYASWSYESQRLLREAQQLQRRHPNDIALMAISVDATVRETNDRIKRDTITAPIICDGRLWQSPLPRKMGLVTMPSNIIADRNGRILKRDIREPKDLKAEIEKMLKE